MARETILEVGAEGGSLSLRRERLADESWRFCAAVNEMAIYESLSEEDRGSPGDYLPQSGYVESLQEALKILDKYPWITLTPLNVHPEFFDTIMAEVRKRGGELEETRWREKLGIQGGLVVNLSDFTDEFIRTRLSPLNREARLDEITVRAVSDKDWDRADREEQVRKWLNHCKVIRFFRPETSKEIAKQIIEFADGPRRNDLHQNKTLIVAEYERLRERIHAVIPPNPKTGGPREITSLVSKVLWCCYPEDVPIFDYYAERALQVISRLFGFLPAVSQTGYGCYVEVWLQLYQRVEPVIDQSNLKDYPYKIRVLDAFLWHLGQPTFDRRKMMILRDWEPVGLLRPDGSIQSDLPELQQLNSIWQKEGIFTMCPSNKSTEEVTVDGAKLVMPSEDIYLVIGSLEELGYKVSQRHE